MGLLQKLKSLLGLGSRGSRASPTDPDVTVEREPSAETERAVKEAAEPSDAGTPEPATTADTAAEPGDGGAAVGGESAGDARPVEEIDGIGPTYADRLGSIGVETVADLAASDVGTVAEATEASRSRVEDWFEQAED